MIAVPWRLRVGVGRQQRFAVFLEGRVRFRLILGPTIAPVND
jgi:hypothetical protein